MSGITPRVAALFIHPLKSAAPVPLQRMAFDELGAVGDRRWLLVDPAGKAITQRDAAAMARIVATVGDGESLRLRAPGQEELVVEVPSSTGIIVDIWRDRVSACDAGDVAADWCSIAAEVPCRLVHLASDAVRALAPKYAGSLDPSGRRVAFADGAPILMLGQASLDGLNNRLSDQRSPTIGVERFRPNILITTAVAHEEDDWLEVRIGDMRFGVGAPCVRCVMTTIDQHAGKRDGHEPLRTLATYRRIDGDVLFAVNATHASSGSIAVGDVVEVVRMKQGVVVS